MLTLLRSLSSDQAGDFSYWKISSTPIAVPEEGVSCLPRASKLTRIRGASRITTDSTEITQADDEDERKDNGSCRRHRRWRHCPGWQATGLLCLRFNGRVNHRLDACTHLRPGARTPGLIVYLNNSLSNWMVFHRCHWRREPLSSLRSTLALLSVSFATKNSLPGPKSTDSNPERSEGEE